jgi:hypothetical protein
MQPNRLRVQAVPAAMLLGPGQGRRMLLRAQTPPPLHHALPPLELQGTGDGGAEWGQPAPQAVGGRHTSFSPLQASMRPQDREVPLVFEAQWVHAAGALPAAPQQGRGQGQGQGPHAPSGRHAALRLLVG